MLFKFLLIKITRVNATLIDCVVMFVSLKYTSGHKRAHGGGWKGSNLASERLC